MPEKIRKLVFMDSGIGGIPYLRWVRERRPGWEYLYIADNLFFPYGGRDSEELTERLLTLTARIEELYQPDIVILACNTASVTALGHLRSSFTMPFVGVVPAVKPAAERYSAGKIGVLATQGTVEGPYLKELIRKFAGDRDVVDPLAAPDLVRFVEKEYPYAEESRIREIVMPYLREAEKREWTYMVLGCTHFLFLKPWFEKWKNPGLTIVDSTEGVGRRILSLLDNKELSQLSGDGTGGRTRFLLTAPESAEEYTALVQKEKMELHYLKEKQL